jgi:hypothetical protein
VAEIRIEGDGLVLAMTLVERLEGLRKRILLPLESIKEVRAVTNPWRELRGIRAPGMGLPRVFAVGTRRGSFGKDFACVHGHGEAVVVDLCDEAEFHRLVVTTEDADSVVASIEAARTGIKPV